MSFDYNFLIHANIKFGVGARNYLFEYLQSKDFKNVALVIDKNIIDLNIIDELLKKLDESVNVKKVEYDFGEPTYNDLESKRLSQDNKVEAFIGIGGGSVIDFAKGLAVLSANSGPALSYRGFNKFEEPIPEIIAIPTTAGTGSEITPNASFVDSDSKKKMGINGEAIRPSFSILDPELTISCPKNATISAGLDSIVHATEAYAAKKSNPMAKFFAREGVKYVFENLPKVVKKSDDIGARSLVMHGAFLAGIALMNSGTGPSAAMSYPLGVHLSVPHGIGGAIFLPYVMKFNVDNGFEGYEGLLNVDSINPNNNSQSEYIVKKYFELWKELDVSTNLINYGYSKDNEDLFVGDVLALKPAIEQNPVEFGENEIRSLLKELS